MVKHTKPMNWRFHSNDGQRRTGSEGMVLIIVMMVAVLLLIAMTAVLPSVYQEGQREREEELIFRGTQYGKAVALFHKQFGRYPTGTKELLQTNGIRFLRQEYRDPMDPKGKWRFIHVNAAGVLLDSINQPLNQNNSNPAGIGSNNSANPGQGGSSFGSSSFGSSSFGGSSSGSSSFGSSSFGSSSMGSSSMGNSSSMGGQGGFGNSGVGSSMGGGAQLGSTSSMFGGSNDIQGAFIAGVAATSHHASIRIWQKHQHYDEWEFLGIDMGIFGVQVGMGGGSAAPGMTQPTSPQGSSFSSGSSGGSFGATPPTSSFGSPSN